MATYWVWSDVVDNHEGTQAVVLYVDKIYMTHEYRNKVAITLLIAALLLLWSLKQDKSLDKNSELLQGLSGEDFSSLRARRRTAIKGGDDDPEIIGTRSWVALRWSKHLELEKGGGGKGKLDVGWMAAEVDRLAASEKYLQAGQLLLWMEKNKKDSERVHGLVSNYELVKQRFCFACEFKERIHDEEGYILSSSDSGKTVWYKKSSTKKDSIVVKVQAHFKKCDVTHLMAFAKECHTCKSWIPFTRHAAEVVDARPDDGIESVVHVCVGLPGISRDILMHFWCNDFDDNGIFWFFANSVGEGQGVYGWHDIFLPSEVPKRMAIRASVKYAGTRAQERVAKQRVKACISEPSLGVSLVMLPLESSINLPNTSVVSPRFARCSLFDSVDGSGLVRHLLHKRGGSLHRDAASVANQLRLEEGSAHSSGVG